MIEPTPQRYLATYIGEPWPTDPVESAKLERRIRRGLDYQLYELRVYEADLAQSIADSSIVAGLRRLLTMHPVRWLIAKLSKSSRED